MDLVAFVFILIIWLASIYRLQCSVTILVYLSGDSLRHSFATAHWFNLSSFSHFNIASAEFRHKTSIQICFFRDHPLSLFLPCSLSCWWCTFGCLIRAAWLTFLPQVWSFWFVSPVSLLVSFRRSHLPKLFNHVWHLFYSLFSSQNILFPF